MTNPEHDTLLAEIRGETFKFTEFNLTFGDVLAAKQKARVSKANKADWEKRHELLWLTQTVFQKNDIDKDIGWIKDVPMHEMERLMKLIEEHNPRMSDD